MLKPGVTTLDIKKFCEDNLLLLLEKEKRGNCNLDYIDGVKNTLIEILENYFDNKVIKSIYKKAAY